VTQLEYPLSHGQRALWYVHRSAPDSAAYNVSHAWRVTSPAGIDPAILRRVLATVVQRHPALRTTYFLHPDGEPRQRVAMTPALDFEEIDAHGWDEARVRRWVADEAHRPFDLERGPVLRSRVLRTAQESPILLVAAHHIALDGWSLHVLLDELDHLYARECGLVTQDLLPADQSDYYNYVRLQDELLSGEEGRRQLQYWTDRLAGDPPAAILPTDCRRGKSAASGAQCGFEIPQALVKPLRSIATGRGTTLYVVLLAAFQVLLSRYTSQDDFVVGSPMSGRRRATTRDTFGYLVNPVCLRASLDRRSSFTYFLQETHRLAQSARDHQDLPLLRLAEQLKVQRIGEQPMFQTLLVVEDRRIASTILHREGEPLLTRRVALEMKTFAFEQRTTQFDLVLVAGEVGEAVGCAFRYRSDLFRPDTITRMAGHFGTLLESVAVDPERRMGELAMLTPQERRQAVVAWNQTTTPLPADPRVHRLIEAQVGRSPDAAAVSFDGQSISYRELNGRANHLARRLQALGVAPDHIVGVCSPRSIQAVVGIVAILKAGGAYLPLDPTQPVERLAEMAADAGCHIVLVDEPLLSSVRSWCAARFVPLPKRDEQIPAGDDENLEGTVDPEHVAYVIYTSGSTGRPKGVMVPHRAICNQLLWRQSAYPLDSADTAVQVLPVSFDPSIWELFGPLIAGARVVLARTGGHQEPAYLARLIRQERVTTLQLTPRLLRLLLDEPGFDAEQSLRQVHCGGEPLTGDLRARFMRSSSARLIHLYGPTETAIDATSWECRRDPEVDGDDVTPIGRPIANARVYVLDQYLQPVPIGHSGELYIGGLGLARGYVGDPELTQQKFVPDPFLTGERMYRTGDVVRHRADGVLEFIGREDHQIKIHGFRVELGEVESALESCPGVSVCAVGVDRGRSGEASLVAYVETPASSDTSAGQLRHFLRARLPYYMCPSEFVIAARLPHLSSGKLDRAALSKLPRERGSAASHHVAPCNSSELAVARIWQEILEVPAVGVTDDFFLVGGHSLLAIRLLARLERELELSVPLGRFLQEPTVRGLLRTLHADDNSPLVTLNAGGKDAPFYCVAAGHGDQVALLRLARQLGPDQPFFALVPPPALIEAPPHERTRRLVALYAQAIGSVLPEGPIWLGGYSAGGVVAVELARQFSEQAIPIAGVMLLDTQYPVALSVVLEGLRIGRTCLSMVARRQEPDWLARLRALFNDAGFETTIHALVAHRPQAANVPFVLFLARSSPMRWSHTTWQWRRLLGQHLTVRYVDGGHFSAFDERHARGAAAALAAYLHERRRPLNP
jgi:amino acid adenylation domain-containing protein